MEHSHIQWTHHTFNPWFGCTEVSPECAACYARVLMAERLKRCEWGSGAARILTASANWREPLRWERKAAADGVRFRVFCASLADVFDEEVDDLWRDRLFEDVIGATPHLDWLLLTKRPEKAAAYLARFVEATGQLPPNWWFGVTVGIHTSVPRLDVAATIPARVRFVSAEPLLSAVNLTPWLSRGDIQWVIAGGESWQIRHQPRPMNPAWARDLRDQCVSAGAAFFFKQWGAHDERCEYVGKRDVGRLLDGVEWSQIPI